jgi:hypothetical protein
MSWSQSDGITKMVALVHLLQLPVRLAVAAVASGTGTRGPHSFGSHHIGHTDPLHRLRVPVG